ncbi:hypothetical protein AVEN_215728-1 [Araneus ventricosus]|uniref:Uncharacterized protein n=1 Tax=Araneus ventricosus TaxID=182803 RepID=A0A4Y2FJ31_ARAVE|nr:hypothetical protein AVEN_215728-1 [Araneus ventricosus]
MDVQLYAVRQQWFFNIFQARPGSIAVVQTSPLVQTKECETHPFPLNGRPSKGSFGTEYCQEIDVVRYRTRALPFIPSLLQSSNTRELLVRRKRRSNALCHKMSVYPPTVPLKLQWLKNILTNNLSRTRLRLLMRFICDENNLIVEDNH